MDKYRVLCRNEFYDLLERYASNITIDNARKFVKEYFPESAYKVFIHTNSTYNDCMYDLSPVVMVLDKEGKELQPVEEFSSSTVVYDIFRLNDTEDQWQMDDIIFYMNTPTEIPQLYIKIEDGKEKND